MTRKRRSRVKHYLLPHKGNGYKPQIFALSSVAAIALSLALLQGAYFFTTQVVFKDSNFLASVLPGALVALTNEDREANNVAELIDDSHLARAAQLKADDMAAKGYFAHVSPEGYQPWHWLEEVDYDYTYAGENLAVNFTDSRDVEEAWMNSPTHRANIVKPEYTNVGIATAQGMYKGKEVTFVVQMLATPPQTATLTAEPVQEESPAPEEEVAPEAVPEPPAAVVVEPETDTVVLGETVAQVQVDDTPVRAFFDEAATSPTHTLIYFLSGLAVAVLILLLIAYFVRINVQYLEVMGGGLVLLMIILGFLLFNLNRPNEVEIPRDSQSASVFNAF